MIQRIQTIYLALAGLLSLALFFMPIVYYFTPKGIIYLQPCTFSTLMESWAFLSYLLPLVLALTSALAIYAIFQFKNRRKQLKIVAVSFLANIIFVLSAYWITYLIEMQKGSVAHYTIGAIFPVVSIIALSLASKAIKKDEALVQSANRIR